MKLLISLAAAPKVPSWLTEGAAQAKSDREMYSYMIDLWLWANSEYFNRRLERIPRFLFQLPAAAADDPQNPQGLWFPDSHHMYIGAQHFTKGWKDVLNVTLHEMCHQAVTEIDRKEEKDAHGPRWQKWMKLIGQPINKIMWLRDPEAKLTKTQEKNWDKTNSTLNSTQSNRLTQRQLKLGTPVRFMDRVHYKLHNEVYVGKVKHEGVMCWVLVGESDIGTKLVTYHDSQYSLFEATKVPSPALLRHANKMHKYMGLK